MKSVYTLCFLSILSFESIAQYKFSGQILNQDSKKPIAYVNVGIVGKPIGTVSSVNGKFELNISSSSENDILKMSMLGFEPKSYMVSDLIKMADSAIFYLKPSPTTLNEVVVVLGKEKKIKAKKSNISVGFYSGKLGGELGKYIINDEEKILTEFVFNVKENLNDSLILRLNFYDVDTNKMPTKKINTQNIYIDVRNLQGEISVDLEPFAITVLSNFVVTLEWIEDKNKIMFNALNTGDLYIRSSSQGLWVKTIVSPDFKIY